LVKILVKRFLADQAITSTAEKILMLLEY